MDEPREEWVTPKQASEEKKVGLTAHRINELASAGAIVTHQLGARRLVRVIFNVKDARWDLMWIQRPDRRQNTEKAIPDSDTRQPQESGKSQDTESDSEAADMIRELESDSIFFAGKRIDMAWLFWTLSQFFLDGLERGSIFPTLMETLPEGNGVERADAANEAARKLMFSLSTLQLVHDENRQYGLRGQTVVVSTAMGARVIRALRSRSWTSL